MKKIMITKEDFIWIINSKYLKSFKMLNSKICKRVCIKGWIVFRCGNINQLLFKKLLKQFEKWAS